MHPTEANGTVSCLYRKSAFVDPVCVSLAKRIGIQPSHGDLIRLLECAEVDARTWSRGTWLERPFSPRRLPLACGNVYQADAALLKTSNFAVSRYVVLETRLLGLFGGGAADQGGEGCPATVRPATLLTSGSSAPSSLARTRAR